MELTRQSLTSPAAKKLRNVLLSVFTLAMIFYQTGFDELLPAGDIGEEIEFARLRELKKRKDSDGRRVSLTGYLRLPGHVRQNFLFGRRINNLILSREPNGQIFELVPVTLAENRKNSFFVPHRYSEKDAKYYDNEGRVLDGTSKIRVSFSLSFVRGAEPEKNPTTGEFAWTFKRVRLN